ncbi:RNA 3'-terminal phosphate cyclase (ATP) [Acinetobacter calcoaceticus]|uniref:RNA 3'-terminal phosphate cyclase n=1 Tax=Acinetobacter calcoaceticus TaxID=471 RepID=A0A4R1XSJ4_ACICA|nr:RNA 3'-terminal phosphate cyclase (ATP) [Acinetobacter calcoaceticus]
MMNTLKQTKKMIQIDGSIGEGGGQILRTALALSMITGIPFELINIRAGRKKPGLMRQHLVCVQASERISHASVDGATLHSQRLLFKPQQVQAGHYDFHIGSAGSTTLVLQTLLPALLLQDQTSQLSIHGGTHNPLAPSADFIAHCFIPALNQLGAEINFKLQRAGFFPIGAGQIDIQIQPWQQRLAYSKLKRSTLISSRAYAAALNLSPDIAQRELEVLGKKLDLTEKSQQYLNGISQGNSAFVHLDYADHQQVFSTLGEKRKTAEQVAKDLATQVKSYLDSGAVADEYLADQLLLPLALGRGGEFSAQVISEHTRTQAEMIQRFLDCNIEFEALPNGIWKVKVIAAHLPTI